jgi:HEAT repeat protein
MLRPRVVSFLVALALSLGASGRSHAFEWPDVAARIERDLSAPDAATRRAAARDLRTLGRSDGVPLTIAALDDADDDVRIFAAEAAIRLRALEASDIVVGWLNAPNPRLRREACAVTRALPNPRAVPALARTLGDSDPEVRVAAADALGHQRSADAVAPLLGRLDDSTPAVRIALVGALARLGDPRAVVPLVGKVEDSSADVRQAVARALGDLGDARASSALVLALRDQSAEVQREALIALGRLQATDAVDAIAPFVSERSSALRGSALEALGRMATPDAVRVLTGVLGVGDDASPSQEPTAVRAALVNAGDAVVAPLHVLLAAAPSAASASSAAWVLGALHAHSEAAAIVGALRRGVLPAAAALHALAGAGTSAELPVVLEFLADASPAVRSEAVEATLALLDPALPDGRAVEPLAAALRDPRPSPEQRALLVEALGRTGAARASALLVQLVDGHDGRIRLAAIDALGNLGAEGGDAALVDALASPEPDVRLHAAVALSEAGGRTARDALMVRLDGPGELDRPTLLMALGGVLARAPTDAAVAKLSSLLAVAAGPERDATLEAIGRAPLASAARALAHAARSEEPSDRATAASLCAAQNEGPGEPVALATARALLSDDADGRVRAQAAWALGTLGDANDLPRLEATARAADPVAAGNATAALARIAGRSRLAGSSGVLCALAADRRTWVRANALAGLALAGARCPGGTLERAALAEDPSAQVRAAAARALAREPNAEDLVALDRCAHSDVSGLVAARCRTGGAPPSRTHAVLVFAVPDGGEVPRPGAPYALLLPDGLLRAGTTDRRGAVFDPRTPEGFVTLVPLWPEPQ